MKKTHGHMGPAIPGNLESPMLHDRRPPATARFKTRTQKPADPAAQERRERLAQLLRTIRKKKGMSIRAVALYSGVSDSFLSQVERGIASASPDTLRKLAKPLGILFEDLMRTAGYLDETAFRDAAEPLEEEVLPHLPARQAKLLSQLEEMFRNSPPETVSKIEIMLKALIKCHG